MLAFLSIHPPPLGGGILISHSRESKVDAPVPSNYHRTTATLQVISLLMLSSRLICARGAELTDVYMYTRTLAERMAVEPRLWHGATLKYVFSVCNTRVWKIIRLLDTLHWSEMKSKFRCDRNRVTTWQFGRLNLDLRQQLVTRCRD